MQSDIKSIEEGIKKDVKESQDIFAKTVAEEVSLSVVEELTKIVNQLDNETSVNQMKAKLEKIKVIVESVDFQAVLDGISNLNTRMESDGELIANIDSKVDEYDNYFQDINNSVTTMDSVLKEVHKEIGDGLCQQIFADIEQEKIEIDELKSIEEDILLNVKRMSSYLRGDDNLSLIELIKKNIDFIGKVSSTVDKLYTNIMSIDLKTQFDIIQKIADTTSDNKQLLAEMKSILSDFSQVNEDMREIKMEIKEIQSVFSTGLEKCDNEHLIKEIGTLKNTIKYLFWFNGITVIGIIGMVLLL